VATAAERRRLLAVDVAVALWAALWVALGIVAYLELRDLRQLSDTVIEGSEALDQTADGLRTTSAGLRRTGEAFAFLEDLPLVGDVIGNELENAASEVDRVAARVEETAESARVSGAESKESVDDVAVIVGLAIGLVPSVLAVAGYLPFRSRRVRRALGLTGAGR
jgi:hypothetical protein